MSWFKRRRVKEPTFPCACPYCGEIARYFAFLLPASGAKDEKLTGNLESGDLIVDQFNCPKGFKFEYLREREGSDLPNAAVLKSDGRSIRLTKRVCPKCHKELYSDFGMLRQKSISIIGSPESGKTTYLCALYGRLRQTFSGTNTDGLATNLEILEKNSKVLHDQSLGRETPEDALKWVATSEVSDPYIFRNTRNMFYLRDIPGEYFNNENAGRLSLAGNYIKSSDAMIFIIDFGHIDEAIEVIHTIHDSFGGLSVETAFVITKKDLIQSTMDIPAQSPVWRVCDYTDGRPISTDEIRTKSRAIRDTIVKNRCEQLLSCIDEYMGGRKGTWFISGVFDREGNFNTEGLEEPFLWLLGKLGMYRIEGG